LPSSRFGAEKMFSATNPDRVPIVHGFKGWQRFFYREGAETLCSR
jgi:hypothetical protein